MAFFPTSVLDQAVLNEQLKALFAPATASGSIASFTDGGDDIPVSEFECEIGATGFTQADIVVCGINIWNEDWENGAYSVSDGTKVASSVQIRNKNPIPIKGGLTYYVKTPVVFYILKYDKMSNYIGYSVLSISDTITLDENIGYICFYTQSGYSTYNNDISINYPSTDISYHTYTGNTYTVSFGASFNSGNLIYKNGEWYIDDNGTITPITSSTRVKTISGDNNIYSNTGDCELKYFTNKADSLAELIKAFVV